MFSAIPQFSSPESDYSHLPTTESESEFPEKILPKPKSDREKWKGSLGSPTPWIFSTFTLLFVLVIQNYRHWVSSRIGTYETGFATEFKPFHESIEVKPVQFSGTLRYTDEGHLYIDLGPGGIRYFGVPGPEVDAAWEELIGDHWTVGITEEEAESLGSEYPSVVGPDTIHTLHCVNFIRKLLDSEYYHNNTLPSLNRSLRVHGDHCLNHIRQIIQCHVDLTPIKRIYYASVNSDVGEFDSPHTCRDFSKLKDWMRENSKGYRESKEVEGRNHGYVHNSDALKAWGDGREGEFS